MKKTLLSLGLLLGIASSAIAQPCGLTLTKSGTGLTRTYTLSSTAPAGASYYISAYNSINTVQGYSNSTTLTMNYNYGGVYDIYSNVNGGCSDSVNIKDTVIGPPPPPPTNNTFRVITHVDTTNGPPSYSPQVKSWLIKKDNITGTLTAVDSIMANPFYYHYYVATFYNVSDGTYLAKSHIVNQPASAATNFLPTYSDSASYWSSADSFTITGGSNTFGDVHMLTTVSPFTGPGFVGGLISAGANKGTAEGDPVKGVTVLLRNATGKVVKMVTTGTDGKYAFSNLPTGTYTVYPEELNYRTTVSDPISVTTVQTRMGVNFKRNVTAKEYVPGSVLGVGTIGESTFSIAPNPATDKLQISLGKATGKVTATLSNSTGQVVLQEVINGNNASLSVSQLPAGIYLLQLQNGKEVRTEKVQIQH